MKLFKNYVNNFATKYFLLNYPFFSMTELILKLNKFNSQKCSITSWKVEQFLRQECSIKQYIMDTQNIYQ